MNAPLSWAEVERGFFVASRSGEFAGYIDVSPDGHYVAFDGYSTPVGRYPTLSEAKSAVLAPVTTEREIRRTRAGQVAAAVTGGVAGALALTAGALAPML